MENIYHNSLIYTIEHNENKTLLYVGSTTHFKRRMKVHKEHVKNRVSKLYKTIRDNGGWNCFTMKIYKQFKCDTKLEMFMEEQRMCIELGATLNMNRAYTTETQMKEYHKQWRETHQQEIKEKGKQYYQDNKEKILEQMKEYRKINEVKLKETIVCECGRSVTRDGISKHKKTNVHKEWEMSK